MEEVKTDVFVGKVSKLTVNQISTLVSKLVNTHDFEINFIDKGLSHADKYFIKTSNNKKFLLRIIKKSNAYRINKEYNLFDEWYNFRTDNKLFLDKVVEHKFDEDLGIYYVLMEWVEGETAYDVFNNLEEKKQYKLGIKIGRGLRSVHKNSPLIDSLQNKKNWEDYILNEFHRSIDANASCHYKVPYYKNLIDFISKNLHLLENRPQCYKHNDFGLTNTIVNSEDNTIKFVDFDEVIIGDPWEDLIGLDWCIEQFPYGISGIIDGYFSFNIPSEFFKLFLIYDGIEILSRVTRIIQSNHAGETDKTPEFVEDWINKMKKSSDKIAKDYNNFSAYIPDWYTSIETDRSIRNLRG